MSTKAWREGVVYALRRTGCMTVAAELAGVSRQTVYHARKVDRHFRAELDAALEDRARKAADAIRRRVDLIEII